MISGADVTRLFADFLLSMVHKRYRAKRRRLHCNVSGDLKAAGRESPRIHRK
jgi:hypothetical protein